MGLTNSVLKKEMNFFYLQRISSLDPLSIIKVAAGSFSAALTNDNDIILWGSGEFGNFTKPKNFS